MYNALPPQDLTGYGKWRNGVTPMIPPSFFSYSLDPQPPLDPMPGRGLVGGGRLSKSETSAVSGRLASTRIGPPGVHPSRAATKGRPLSTSRHRDSEGFGRPKPSTPKESVLGPPRCPFSRIFTPKAPTLHESPYPYPKIPLLVEILART